MPDIFISYSRKDSEQALKLAETLRSNRMEVWIDQHGIEGATRWSEEIVEQIDSCRAFILLLSTHSNQSPNVVKEVSIAYESDRKILPVDLEPVELAPSLYYPIAGIQRVPITNTDAIIRALVKLGLEATPTEPAPKPRSDTTDKKSLMILPFEDLSPIGDNLWFADGIVTELIGTLSNVKSLRVTDQQTTREFKSYKGTLARYAKEMGVRYFVQGSVRKFGDQIKISSTLLDIESGEHLWQDSFKGEMVDVFDIQETVSKNVVDGLQILLTNEEQERVEEHQTRNPEAFELYQKAIEYYGRHTHLDYDRALALLEDAAQRDPQFAKAHLGIATTALTYYRTYSSIPHWINKACEHIEKAAAILGEAKGIYWIRSTLATIEGRKEDALQLAIRAVALDPEYSDGYNALGFAYLSLGMRKETADAWEKEVMLRENNRAAHFNYLSALSELGDVARLTEAALRARQVFERHLRLTPEDLHSRVEYVNILWLAGERERALREAASLEQMDGLDGTALYNLACLFVLGGRPEDGMRLLRKSVGHGFQSIQDFYSDPDLEPLRKLHEFQLLVTEVEQKIASERNG